DSSVALIKARDCEALEQLYEKRAAKDSICLAFRQNSLNPELLPQRNQPAVLAGGECWYCKRSGISTQHCGHNSLTDSRPPEGIVSVLSARICRDLATRNSMGYGSVIFEDPKDAERVLEDINHAVYHGQPIRNMWSRFDPFSRQSGKGNISVENLDRSTEQKELCGTLCYFGRVFSWKIAVAGDGHSKGYEFVHFEKEECAERAVEKINRMPIHGRIVFVGKFVPSCVEEDADGKPKGSGFVCFLNPDNVEQAAKPMHGKKLAGRNLYANRAQREQEGQEEFEQRLEKRRLESQSKYLPGVSLHVKNLDNTINDERLKKAFCHYGSFTSTRVMAD
ncbi:hypothetical protein P879_01354, partial [Paragonimus westermani]